MLELAAGFVVTTAVTTVILFYLNRLIGAQARYVGLAALHPVRPLRGEWLCPQCLGSSRHNEGVCWHCFHDYLTDHMPMGYVGVTLAVKLWDWKRWQAKGGYYTVRKWNPPDSHYYVPKP